MYRVLLLGVLIVAIPVAAIAQEPAKNGADKGKNQAVASPEQEPSQWVLTGPDGKQLRALVVKQIEPAPETHYWPGLPSSMIFVIILVVMVALLALIASQLSGIRSALDKRP